MSNNFVLITRELEFILAEQRALEVCGPHIKLYHRGRKHWAKCWPGEETESAVVVHATKEFQIPLSATGLLIFDCFATHRHLAQSAAQIALRLRTEPFYSEHGANLRTGSARRRPISRSVIKTYINRIRRALGAVFAEAGLDLDPYSVLVSTATESNVMTYRLRATVEVVHSE